MISRVAECCFWLHRQVERMDNMARLLRVNRSFLLDVNMPAGERWAPVIQVSGERESFEKAFSPESADDGELVQHYLTWNENNPVSIATSLTWARENARSIREVISLELWQSVNTFWHWLRGPEGRALFAEDPDKFYARVQDFGASFQGICESTMLHSEPLYFMRLGMYLERAGQTARILDVKYETEGDHSNLPEGLEQAIEYARCLALLRSCSASESYSKTVRQTPRPSRVAGFLLLENRFPRSIIHCVSQAVSTLEMVRDGDDSIAKKSLEALGQLQASLAEQNAANLRSIDMHTELTRVVETTSQVCDNLSAELFDPVLQSQSQSQSASQG